jgi:Lon protease-like protein
MDGYRVDFGRPIALFALSNVALVPHIAQRFHIFEPRYRQMITDAIAVGNGQLERAAPIAVALGGSAGENPGGLRPVVCVGRLANVEPYDDGRFDIVLQGVCRARIDEIDAAEGSRLYDRGWLRPLAAAEGGEPPMPEVRRTVRSLLSNPRLSRLCVAEFVRGLAAHEELPVSAMLDLVGFVTFADAERRYDLLSHPDCRDRAAIVTRELQELDSLVSLVDRQHPATWPKGIGFN